MKEYKVHDQLSTPHEKNISQKYMVKIQKNPVSYGV